jgi:hypothetical protein
VTLRVVGAGFGRTGTSSLKVALEHLGFSKCHHMREVFGSSRQVDGWLAASHGEDVDWDDLFAGFQASCDWPSSAYWERLAENYPESKVILTWRDPDAWYKSTDSTIYRVTSALPGWLVALVPQVRRASEMVNRTVWDGVFDGRFEDREHALQVYRENTERVKRTIPPERLLVFEAKDGWEPLCAFLGVTTPDEPYPHTNEAKVIRRAIVGLRVLRWLPLALALAIAAIVIL